RCSAPHRAPLPRRWARRPPSRRRSGPPRRAAVATPCGPPQARSRADPRRRQRGADAERSCPRLESDVDVDLTLQLIDVMLDCELITERLPDTHLHILVRQVAGVLTCRHLEHDELRPRRIG